MYIPKFVNLKLFKTKTLNQIPTEEYNARIAGHLIPSLLFSNEKNTKEKPNQSIWKIYLNSAMMSLVLDQSC